jgi:hypothetical protein
LISCFLIFDCFVSVQCFLGGLVQCSVTKISSLVKWTTSTSILYRIVRAFWLADERGMTNWSASSTNLGSLAGCAEFCCCDLLSFSPRSCTRPPIQDFPLIIHLKWNSWCLFRSAYRGGATHSFRWLLVWVFWKKNTTFAHAPPTLLVLCPFAWIYSFHCHVCRGNCSIQVPALISVGFWPCNLSSGLVWFRLLLAPGRCVFSHPLWNSCPFVSSYPFYNQVNLYLMLYYKCPSVLVSIWLSQFCLGCPAIAAGVLVLLILLANSTDKMACLAPRSQSVPF